LDAAGITVFGFAKAEGINRHKLMRVLDGSTKRVDVDFAARCQKAFSAGVLPATDFASWTTDEEDRGAEVQRRLRAVGEEG
jgi:hypothetical protein